MHLNIHHTTHKHTRRLCDARMASSAEATAASKCFTLQPLWKATRRLLACWMAGLMQIFALIVGKLHAHKFNIHY